VSCNLREDSAARIARLRAELAAAEKEAEFVPPPPPRPQKGKKEEEEFVPPPPPRPQKGDGKPSLPMPVQPGLVTASHLT
jgi:hypothetical protein